MDDITSVRGDEPPTPLERFLAANTASRAEQADGRVTVSLPWADSSVELRFEASATDLLDDLNNILLPSRLTAIVHQDLGLTEFLGGMAESSGPLLNRGFTFSLDGKEYGCRFGPSSARAIRIANSTMPVSAETSTAYRNTQQYHIFSAASESDDGLLKQITKGRSLYSLFVSGLPDDEDLLIHVIENLNFYISFYDETSTVVVIHGKVDDDKSGETPSLELDIAFPDSITATSRPAYLLTLWESAWATTDPLRKLLHAYQILEYAAFYFVDAKVRRDVERILSAPDVRASGSLAVAKIMDVLPALQRRDEDKINATVSDLVAPEDLWPVVEAYRAYFSQDQVFEGGFQVSALIKPDCGYEDFRGMWHPKVPDTIRQLRNAAVHAREQRMSTSIAPTRHNVRRLAPWAQLTMAVAKHLIERHR